MEREKYTLISERIKKIVSKKNNLTIIIILIIGVALMLFSSSGTQIKKSGRTPDVQSDEERLEEILSDIDGAGKVSVMITYYGTGEKSLAYEITESSSNTSRDGFGENENSIDKKAVLSNGEPLITEESYPKVKGVVVTAEGADDAAVRLKLLKAVSTVMDVGEHRVCIYSKRRQ